MKVSLLKTIDSADDFDGVRIIAENPNEKMIIKKLSNSDFVVSFHEKSAYNLKKKTVTIQIYLENIG